MNPDASESLSKIQYHSVSTNVSVFSLGALESNFTTVGCRQFKQYGVRPICSTFEVLLISANIIKFAKNLPVPPSTFGFRNEPVDKSKDEGCCRIIQISYGCPSHQKHVWDTPFITGATNSLVRSFAEEVQEMRFWDLPFCNRDTASLARSFRRCASERSVFLIARQLYYLIKQTKWLFPTVKFPTHRCITMKISIHRFLPRALRVLSLLKERVSCGLPGMMRIVDVLTNHP